MAVNYDSLEKAIKDGEEIINDEEVKDFIENIAEELGVEIENGRELIIAGSTQSNVLTKENNIKNLIDKVNIYVEDKLNKLLILVMVLSSVLRTSNKTFASVLNNLEKEVKDESINDKD